MDVFGMIDSHLAPLIRRALTPPAASAAMAIGFTSLGNRSVPPEPWMPEGGRTRRPSAACSGSQQPVSPRFGMGTRRPNTGSQFVEEDAMTFGKLVTKGQRRLHRADRTHQLADAAPTR